MQCGGKLALKRGGDLDRKDVEIDRILVHRPNEILNVHQALEALESHDALSAEVVKLHYFGGYSFAEVADLLSVSRSTTNRCWVYARAWLKTTIEAQNQQSHDGKRKP